MHPTCPVAAFVTTHVPFVVRWAIMQLENIGFARRTGIVLFFDSSVHFDPVADALDIAKARGVARSCTISRCAPYRRPTAPTRTSTNQRLETEVPGAV